MILKIAKKYFSSFRMSLHILRPSSINISKKSQVVHPPNLNLDVILFLSKIFLRVAKLKSILRYISMYRYGQYLFLKGLHRLLTNVAVAMRDQLSDVSMDASLSERDVTSRPGSDRSRSYDEHSARSFDGHGSRSFEGQTSSRSFEGQGQPQLHGKPPAPTLIPPEAYTTSSPRSVDSHKSNSNRILIF